MNEPARPRVSKPVLILWGLVGLLVALGCGTPAKVSSTPAGTSVAATSPATSQATATATVMPDVVGKQLDVAKNDIKSAGFKDKVEIIGGGTLGVVVDGNWKVCAQSPEAGQSLTAAPKLTVERSCGGGGSTTLPTETTTAPTEPPTTSTPEPEGNLTVANSADLAALLIGRDCGDTVEAFASKYQGRTIEFDGYAAIVGGLPTTPPLDRTDARNDLLLFAGDFNNDAFSVGPNFKYRDVNLSDLHLTGPNIPSHVGRGDNLHFVARVGEYNSKQCLFFLEPVSTSVR